MKKQSAKASVLIITVCFVLLYIRFKQPWLLYTAFIIGVAGALSHRMATKLEWFWFKLSYVLSKVFPPIILTIIFYVFLFPLAIVSRRFTRDPLMLLNNSGSTFRDVNTHDIKKSMEKSW